MAQSGLAELFGLHDQDGVDLTVAIEIEEDARKLPRPLEEWAENTEVVSVSRVTPLTVGSVRLAAVFRHQDERRIRGGDVEDCASGQKLIRTTTVEELLAHSTLS